MPRQAAPSIRNKTFIFGDFEATYIRESTTTLSTVPTLAQRNGIFSSHHHRSVYQDCVSPEIRFRSAASIPSALKILSFVPLPQTSAATSNYNYQSPSNQDAHRWDLRVDQIINDKQNLFFRFSDQVVDTVVSSPLPPDNGEYYAGAGANATNSKSFVLGYNQIWTPTIVSSIRAGWNDLAWTNYFPNQSLTSIGIPGVSTVESWIFQHRHHRLSQPGRD